MVENRASSIEDPPLQAARDPAVERAAQAWQAAGRQLRSITPSGLVRFGLVTAALVGIGWLIWVTRISLLPFIVGGVIAYATLPLVNWLDRLLPRIVAVLLTMALIVAAVVAFLTLLIPILVDQLYFVYLSLPTVGDLRSYQQQLELYIATLPGPTQDIINNAFDQTTTRIRENLDDYARGLINLGIATLLRLFNTVSFILGFLVVPAWLLTVLTEQRKAPKAIDRLLPDWLRLDFWAILRIFDRAFGRFIRGQLLIGFVTAVLVYLGLEFLVRLLGRPGNLQLLLLLAIVAGLTQLIPSIGPFLGAIPAIIAALTVSWEVTVMVIAVYVIVQWVVITFVTPQVEKNIIDVHPAILILIIVALSQFGFWWVLLAAPVTAVVRDLFRYVYGRFNEPPRPAGLLPDEPIPATAAPQPSPAPARRRFAFSAAPRRTVRPRSQIDNI